MPTAGKKLAREQVADYYGKVLKTKDDLKTTACCSIETMPAYMQEPLKLIDDEIQQKFYGCGAPFPHVLKGTRILDLGCGTGRDCYILSYLVGEQGEVTGVDMTDEQLEVANRHLSAQMAKFGFRKTNVRFFKGYIEDLESIGLPDGYFDIVISNCVLNLSPDKESVLKEVSRVLKKGGEFFFSDVYANRRLPDWAKSDSVLLGECLGGALYWKDFERLARRSGFPDPRVVSSTRINLHDKEVIDKIGFAQFCSVTYRLFKLPQLEDACEDYGQTAVYKGTVGESPHQFQLDDHHLFLKNKPLPVCSNTAFMLSETRFKDHFDVSGNLSTHFGLFAGCGETPLINADRGLGTGITPGGCC